MNKTIDESHELAITPGPYPEGEGPSDYAECRNCVGDLTEPCAATEWCHDPTSDGSGCCECGAWAQVNQEHLCEDCWEQSH